MRTFPCPNCGGSLEFAPDSATLTCPACRSEVAIPRGEGEAAETKGLDLRAYIERAVAEAGTVERLTVLCRACGARTTLDERVVSARCPYCATPGVANRLPTRQMGPQWVLPFMVKEQEARDGFRRWASSRWLAPRSLAREASVGEMAGVYVPCWLFRAATITTFRGGDGPFDTSGTVSRTFDDVLVPASRSLPPDLADRLEPWDLANLAPYRDDYLVGMRAETYGVDLPLGFERAREKMAAPIRAEMGRRLGEGVQPHAVETRYLAVSFKLILLPVWIAAYRYRGRPYRFLVNARTFAVEGERPWSWLKIGLIAAAAAALGWLARAAIAG